MGCRPLFLRCHRRKKVGNLFVAAPLRAVGERHKQLFGLHCSHFHDPLCSPGFHPLQRYYGIIRLLSRLRPGVVAFTPSYLVTKDRKRSLGVRRCAFLSPCPQYRMNPSENWASCFEAHKPGSSCLTRLHFRSGIHFVSNFLPTEPREPAVVFNSWLPSEGPTADFHRQAHHHVQRTPLAPLATDSGSAAAMLPS